MATFESTSSFDDSNHPNHHSYPPFSSSATTSWPLLDNHTGFATMSHPQLPNSHSHSHSHMAPHSAAPNPDASTGMNVRSLAIATSSPSSFQNMAFQYAPPIGLVTTSAEWQQFPMQTTTTSLPAFPPHNAISNAFGASFADTLQASPIDLITATADVQLNSNLAMVPQFWPMTTSIEQQMPFAMTSMPNFDNSFTQFPMPVAEPAPSSIASRSPGEQWLDYHHSSLGCSPDNDWTMVSNPLSSSASSFEFVDMPGSTIVSPQALHIRTDSSSSEKSPLSAHSYDSYEEIFPMTPPEPEIDSKPCPSHVHSHPHPNSNSNSHPHSHSLSHSHGQHQLPVHLPHVNTSYSKPIAPRSSTSTSPASSSAASPPARRRRKSPAGVSLKAINKKRPSPAGTKDKEKDKSKSPHMERKIGRRRGPLRPDQRQQAHEIRKMGACLRCKYLKKVCDIGDPCTGCKPAHHRLWQVPCTRVDIKDIGDFLKGWHADYERHVTVAVSVANIKGFSLNERPLMINHGYGFEFPIMAREVFVRDEKVFGVDWVEWFPSGTLPTMQKVQTNKLDAGRNGISSAVLSAYIERYIDGGFERWVDAYFLGTPFTTEILKTAFGLWQKTQLPVIRKGLKLVLAYTLTLSLTMVTGLSDEEMEIGRITDQTSQWYGSTVAPVMINFQVKKAMSDLWRELMKDILEELSLLFAGVFSGEKFKNWPTIFISASLLLVIWELMQFDCHYRVPDQAVVDKFCDDMESTPVGVIVGLFQAISTKVPSFSEWDSKKHRHMLQENTLACDVMTAVKSHVIKHEQYLKTRSSEAKYDRGDFDSLSNKFLSKLVIRAGAS